MKFLLSFLLLFSINILLVANSPEITAPITIIDNFDDGDVSDWPFFSGNLAGGGVGPFADRPKAGAGYMGTGWGGMGTASFFYGGTFRNFDNGSQITLPEDPWICFWVYNQSNTTADQYTLEVTIREDLDGNGWTNGSEDSFRFDTTFQSSSFNDEWSLVSAPLSSFFSLGTGGDGTFNGSLDEIVLVISGVMGADGTVVEVDFDEIAFCAGDPCAPIAPIPTLGEWGLLLLGLSLLILGLIGLRQKQVSLMPVTIE